MRCVRLTAGCVAAFFECLFLFLLTSWGISGALKQVSSPGLSSSTAVDSGHRSRAPLSAAGGTPDGPVLQGCDARHAHSHPPGSAGLHSWPSGRHAR